MTKESLSQAFLLIETIIALSPKQKKIALLFYFWFIAWRKGTMKGLHMGIAYIARKASCSEDTVYRFLRDYPYLVTRLRRPQHTNRYTPQETFIHAMQYLDTNNMLQKTKRQQKRWYLNEFRKHLPGVYENVRICDPQCPNLRPNPLLIPDSFRSITGKGSAGSCSPTYKEKKRASQERFITIPDRIDRMNKLSHEIKLKLSMIPEGIFQSALDSSIWKHNNGWVIRDQIKYVVGQAINMAEKQGIYLDWPAYYSSLKKYEREKTNAT